MALDINVLEQDNLLFNSEVYINSDEKWRELLECKNKFLKNQDFDPRTNRYLDREVAASWLRSRQLGIDPYEMVTKPVLSTAELNKRLQDNRELIEITKRITARFRETKIFSPGSIFYLCDKDGTFLLQDGEIMRLPTDGLIWNEKTIGTNAHSLCQSLLKPVQLMGLEHYCLALQDTVALAAPILNEAGKLLATLILSQPLVQKYLLRSFQDIYSQTLCLVSLIAAEIEEQINMQIKYKILAESYERLHSTLETTLSFSEEGIITINRKGEIIEANQEGIKILKLKPEPEQKKTRNINEFLGSQSQVLTLVEKGQTIDIKEVIHTGNYQKSFLVNIRPFLDKNAEVHGAVLRFRVEDTKTKVDNTKSAVARELNALAGFEFKDMIGENREFKKTIALAQRFANSPENILLIGESGAGKELFAQAIHNKSKPEGPYIAVNCAAMPHELILTELFGYEGGSFTGAQRSGRIGKIELANGGTLFLDEIGDMPLDLQAVLLRVLEDKKVIRVGGHHNKEVDFRLIAATNKDLSRMVKEKKFREDLYYRLSVLTIDIPPLRNRKDDIELLCRFFVQSYCRKQGWTVPEISPDTLKMLSGYCWPGNVRQLENALIHAVNYTQDGTIKPENFPGGMMKDFFSIDLTTTAKNNGALEEMLRLEAIERSAIQKALLLTENNIPAAAKLLGIGNATLYRKIRSYKSIIQ